MMTRDGRSGSRSVELPVEGKEEILEAEADRAQGGRAPEGGPS